MAPPMAAAELDQPAPALAELLAELRWPADADVGLLETVGGVRSPVATDGDSRDLVRAAGVDLVVVVADAGLGVIDATRCATEALAPLPTVVLLNRFRPADRLHTLNRTWLEERDQLHVVTDVGALAEVLAGALTDGLSR